MDSNLQESPCSSLGRVKVLAHPSPQRLRRKALGWRWRPVRPPRANGFHRSEWLLLWAVLHVERLIADPQAGLKLDRELAHRAA